MCRQPPHRANRPTPFPSRLQIMASLGTSAIGLTLGARRNHEWDINAVPVRAGAHLPDANAFRASTWSATDSSRGKRRTRAHVLAGALACRIEPADPMIQFRNK